MIATLDWSFSIGRDWGSPEIPDRIDLRTVLRLAPQVARRPRWLAAFARTGRLPDLSVPNLARPGRPAPSFFGAYYEWRSSPPPTWDDVAWMRAEWGGPFLLKGVCRVDDARRAVDAGVTAISVSNHGGNNLDGTPAAIRMLSPVVDAVGDQVEVVLDGGVRRGSDVVKALCLGARAVLIGRAYLWGLAANGQAGVENVLDIMRMGIDSALLGMGVADVHDLGPEHLVIPDGFHRTLGAALTRYRVAALSIASGVESASRRTSLIMCASSWKPNAAAVRAQLSPRPAASSACIRPIRDSRFGLCPVAATTRRCSWRGL